MSVINSLIEQSQADLDILKSLDSHNDHFDIPRPVDFLLYAKDAEKAELVAGFLNDFQYASAQTCNHDGRAAIRAVIQTAVEQHAINCISGFMTMLAHLYDLEYDGWGCSAQSPTTPA